MSHEAQIEPKRLILGISGASGALYAERTLVALAQTPHQVEIVPSKVGLEIFRQETSSRSTAWWVT